MTPTELNESWISIVPPSRTRAPQSADVGERRAADHVRRRCRGGRPHRRTSRSASVEKSCTCRTRRARPPARDSIRTARGRSATSVSRGSRYSSPFDTDRSRRAPRPARRSRARSSTGRGGCRSRRSARPRAGARRARRAGAPAPSVSQPSIPSTERKTSSKVMPVATAKPRRSRSSTITSDGDCAGSAVRRWKRDGSPRKSRSTSVLHAREHGRSHRALRGARSSRDGRGTAVEVVALLLATAAVGDDERAAALRAHEVEEAQARNADERRRRRRAAAARTARAPRSSPSGR